MVSWYRLWILNILHHFINITWAHILNKTYSTLIFFYFQSKVWSFSPPASVFGPVWTSLYILMSLAIWINWINFRDKKTIKIYLFHIFFNSIWSVIFFGLHQIFLALLNLLIILFFIIWLMKIYYKTTKLSFLLMVPYLLWSSFALLLNTSILYLN